jgi:hypothetical protein
MTEFRRGVVQPEPEGARVAPRDTEVERFCRVAPLDENGIRSEASASTLAPFGRARLTLQTLRRNAGAAMPPVPTAAVAQEMGDVDERQKWSLPADSRCVGTQNCLDLRIHSKIWSNLIPIVDVVAHHFQCTNFQQAES